MSSNANTWWSLQFTSDFCDAAAAAVNGESNLLLRLPGQIPWKDEMYRRIENSIYLDAQERRIRKITCPDGDIGRYLLETFCREDVRSEYRAGKSYGRFLAERRDITLNSNILWVSGIGPGRLSVWAQFLTEYRKYLPAGSHPAIFVLESEETLQLKDTVTLTYAAEGEKYARHVFCSLAAETVHGVPEAFQPYLADLADSLCGEDVELSGKCIEYGTGFLSGPELTMRQISEACKRSSGTRFDALPDSQTISRRIWLAQIRFLFPYIEAYRSDFIALHREEIRRQLPVENIFNEVFEQPEEVEIGMLFHMASFLKTIKITEDEYSKLLGYKEVRNMLAHGKSVGYSEMLNLLS